MKISSINDTNPANDARNVAFEIAGSSPAVAEAKSGGGGGGRFEWLSLLLLALLACRRNGVRPHFLANGV